MNNPATAVFTSVSPAIAPVRYMRSSAGVNGALLRASALTESSMYDAISCVT